MSLRDRDVRTAIAAALTATNAFDSVWLTGLPEGGGTGASQLAAAAIEPYSTALSDEWDSQIAGGVIVTSSVRITLLYRHEDQQLRDEAAELLVDIACNALNGQSLAGLTLPALTKFRGWLWQDAMPPERRITSTFSYQYIVEGWGSFDVTP